MSDEQDRADVARVLAGDVDAFAGVVRRWQTRLITLAFRFCRDRDQAEDMAQAAFVAAFRAVGKWRGEAAFSRWLYAIAANTYRSEMRCRFVSPVSFDLDRLDAKGTNNEGSTEDTEGAAVVRRLVATLPRSIVTCWCCSTFTR